MGKLSIRAKLLYLLSVVLVLGFLSTSYLNYLVSKRSLRTSAMTETLPLISDNIYSEIQRNLMQPIHMSSLMAQDTFLKDWVLGGESDVTQVVKYLRTIREKYGYYSTFFVSDRTRNYYYYEGILKQINPEDAHDVWYYLFRDLNAEYDLDVDTDEATSGTLTIFINHRLLDYEGKLLGVAGVGLKMENLGQILKGYQEKYNRLIYMVDSSGLIQVHPDKSMIEKVNIKDWDGFDAVSSLILTEKASTSTFELDHEGKHLFLSARYFPDFDWFLLVQQQETVALAPIRNALVGNLAVGFGITCLVLLVVIWAVNRFQRDLEVMATMDELTGLFNRRHFLELSKREIARARRYQHPISLLLIDADQFKNVNDNHGHDAGDRLLVLLAEAFMESVREIDIVGRLGGDEFVMLLPKADMERALQVAARLRETVAAKHCEVPEGRVQCTISVGVVSSAGGKQDLDTLLKQADQAMYEAKKLGRNQVCVFSG